MWAPDWPSRTHTHSVHSHLLRLAAAAWRRQEAHEKACFAQAQAKPRKTHDAAAARLKGIGLEEIAVAAPRSKRTAHSDPTPPLPPDLAAVGRSLAPGLNLNPPLRGPAESHTAGHRRQRAPRHAVPCVCARAQVQATDWDAHARRHKRNALKESQELRATMAYNRKLLRAQQASAAPMHSALPASRLPPTPTPTPTPTHTHSHRNTTPSDLPSTTHTAAHPHTPHTLRMPRSQPSRAGGHRHLDPRPAARHDARRPQAVPALRPQVQRRRGRPAHPKVPREPQQEIARPARAAASDVLCLALGMASSALRLRASGRARARAYCLLN